MVKVDIVSGFLGAGKTTFIKKLLKGYKNENIVILENEFGEIGIDGEILERDGYKMVEISTGCICCLMQGDFIETMKNIIEDTKPDRIIIEPTGISILSDIVKILKKDPFHKMLVINSLITIVDSENYLEQCEIFGEFFQDQITYATELTFSKIQNVDEETLKNIMISVREMNSSAPIIAKNWDDMSLDEFYGYLNGDNVLDYDKEMLEPDKRSCREHKFSTFAMKLDNTISKKYLENSLIKLQSGEYGQVLRGKGFLKCDDGNYEFSYTNKVFKISEVEDDVSCNICFIGVGLNKNKLNALWKRNPIKLSKMRCLK